MCCRERVLCVLTFVLIGACHAPSDAHPARRLPNIVMLYADDLGYGDLACYNPESRIPTPNLDRLATQGMRCLDAHSSSGICSPSRYSLLTGRHHWRQFHEIVNSFEPSVFQPGRMTMANLLQQRGYRTACIGKWHLGWNWNAIQRPGAEQLLVKGKTAGYAPDAFDWTLPIPDGPLAHGFDHYFGDDVPNFPPYAWIIDDRVEVAPTMMFAPDPEPKEGSAEGRPGPMVAGWRLDAVMPRLTTHAVEWLHQQQAAQPFFLYFPFTAPHAPIVPSAEFEGRSGAGPYGDYVAQVDATVGAVLDTLDELGMADNTLVVFSSDNGPERYAYDRVRNYAHRSMAELRGLKRDVYEGGHRVPLIVRWPGVVHPGSVSPALIGQVDLMATVAHAVGSELPKDAAEDSFDLTPLLAGQVDEVRPFLVHNTYAQAYALRRGDWLLLDAKEGSHNPVPEWWRQAEGMRDNPYPVALFDLRADPSERENLCMQHPEVVKELQALLHVVRDQGYSSPHCERP